MALTCLAHGCSACYRAVRRYNPRLASCLAWSVYAWMALGADEAVQLCLCLEGLLLWSACRGCVFYSGGRLRRVYGVFMAVVEGRLKLICYCRLQVDG